MVQRGRGLVVLLACALATAGCTSGSPTADPPPADRPSETASAQAPSAGAGAGREITVAFAGDVHFEAHLLNLLGPGGGLGPISRTLRRADLAMLNMETAVTSRGTPDPKELEEAGNRYHFRAPAGSFDTLADAGIDVVAAANNHAGDYGRIGLLDTLAAGKRAGVAVVGAGRNLAGALRPYVARVKGVSVAFLAADTVQREGSSGVWQAGEDNAGIATARGRGTAPLLEAVEDAAAKQDLVVVYLHWGRENDACPTQSQRLLARALADAGADAIVGSHSHVLGGAGWAGDSFVSYGLGNFVWYHNRQADTGVLTLRMNADGVLSEAWTPAEISGTNGQPLPLAGAAARTARSAWVDRHRCTGLSDQAGQAQAEDPEYESTISPIDAEVRERMRSSYRPGCPVAPRDLRYLQMTYRDFHGVARTGEMIVHRRVARAVTQVFEHLYHVGAPIARMRLVDDYDGDDNASMAANNSSAFNCRRVAGQQTWSDHAYGAAIDINPIQNPYVLPNGVLPPAGGRYAFVDRTRSAKPLLGLLRQGDQTVAAFNRIGWEWGGYWATKDYQHFSAVNLPAPSAGRAGAP